jgi:hypothetical protein
MDEKSESHFKDTGKLVVNMQSFETIIRGFLYNDEVAKGTASSAQIDFSKVKQGDIVLKNAFTNYDAMRDLIRKYNSDSRIMSAALTVDEALADIRDAIAHGRLFSSDLSDTMQLLKFKRPNKDKVGVAFSESMTKDWFRTQVSRFYDATLKVIEANERLESGRL